jgi:uncharacterized protein YggU (UPF0235/DUF167 family)
MGSILLKVYLQPKSSKNEIVGSFRDGIKINPVRKDGALNPTFSKMSIIYFYHSRHKWRGFLTG